MPGGRYEFRVEGRLSDDLADEFRELEVTRAVPETVMHGEIADEAHLHGILARFRSLGLKVIAMREVPR